MAGWYILFNTCLSNISLILSSLFLHQSYYTAFKVVAICQAVSVETRDMDWVERPFRFCQSGLSLRIHMGKNVSNNINK